MAEFIPAKDQFLTAYPNYVFRETVTYISQWRKTEFMIIIHNWPKLIDVGNSGNGAHAEFEPGIEHTFYFGIIAEGHILIGLSQEVP